MFATKQCGSVLADAFLEDVTEPHANTLSTAVSAFTISLVNSALVMCIS
jgi:hypothetical protein